MSQKKILVAPLNWGLGHATRCIPIIRALQEQGAAVVLASDGVAYDLLREEFPNLPIYQLPAYNIRYPFRSMMLSMAIQMPKILRGCIAEHIWLKKFLKIQTVDAVISDNRFGFFNRKIYSVFMTHQVNILVPIPFFQTLANAINHFFIQKFDVCWIPDQPDVPNLAGQLAHGIFSKGLNTRYIGVLSRLKRLKMEKKYKAAIILSGPEPQRTILEKKLWQQLTQRMRDEPFLFVRGTRIQADFDKNTLKNVEIYDVLTSVQLNEKIAASEVVICRSGYSSVMDLAAIQKPAVLIPTPSQTEQEYLARMLMQQGQCFSLSQDTFDLEKALEMYPKYKNFSNFDIENKALAEIISELLNF
ncbi:MAG: hypothetical protein JNL70_09405 [Saprospiraceae bacterium]|nr:hypothetical protein [Saprospiraceae bacterium]